MTTDVPGAPWLVFSGTAARFIACVLDAILLFLLAIIVLMLATVLSHEPDVGTANSLIATSVGLSLPFALFFWTGRRHATPGQRLFRIQVGNGVEGRQLTATQAFRRWLALGWFAGALALVPALLGPVVAAVAVWSAVLLVTTMQSWTRQGLHDRIAGTAVVRPRDASNRLVVGGLILLVVGPPLLLAWLAYLLISMVQNY